MCNAPRSHVLVTRPKHQSAELIVALEQLGVQVSSLPLLEIIPSEPTKYWQQTREQLDLYQVVICISYNAANLGLEYFSNYWPQWPVQQDWWAVGRKTAKEIEAWGLAAQFPLGQETSESLLEVLGETYPEFFKCLILKGFGGRPLLQDQLESIGHTVDSLELYERRAPVYNKLQLASALTRSLDVICISSGEALNHLMTLQKDTEADIFYATLVVPSERLSLMAKQLGFSQVVAAGSANTEDQVICIKKLIKCQ